MNTRIRVATYNIHKCRGLDRRTDPERVAAVIAELDADVIRSEASRIHYFVFDLLKEQTTEAV